MIFETLYAISRTSLFYNKNENLTSLLCVVTDLIVL